VMTSRPGTASSRSRSRWQSPWLKVRRLV
jgi:hypothetical protein